MGDSENAYRFGTFFRMLAEDPISEKDRQIADWLFDESRTLDFAYDELEADEALIKLGLAYRDEGDGELFYEPPPK